MKKIFLILTVMLITCLSALAYNFYDNSKYATCTGDTPCKACKNCKYCKHCAKDGGTCGMCKK